MQFYLIDDKQIIYLPDDPIDCGPYRSREELPGKGLWGNFEVGGEKLYSREAERFVGGGKVACCLEKIAETAQSKYRSTTPGGPERDEWRHLEWNTRRKMYYQ